MRYRCIVTLLTFNAAKHYSSPEWLKFPYLIVIRDRLITTMSANLIIFFTIYKIGVSVAKSGDTVYTSVQLSLVTGDDTQMKGSRTHP